MALRVSRFAAGLALAASLSMASAPAMARGWGGGGFGWGGGWGGGRGHHDDGISAGDVFAGILIIGGIAAIASAASKADRERRTREQDRDYRYPDRDAREPSGRYGNERDDSRYRSSSSRTIDDAVDTCVGEVERSANRVDTVDGVDRDGDGWRVSGRTSNGRSFECAVDGSGRVRSATVDGRAAYAGERPVEFTQQPVVQNVPG